MSDSPDMSAFERSLRDPNNDPAVKDVVDRVSALLVDLQQGIEEIRAGLKPFVSIDDHEMIMLTKVQVDARVNDQSVLITVTEDRGPRVTVRRSPYDRGGSNE